MEGLIRKIGNSSGLIIPKSLIEKYNLQKVTIEDTGNGILIKPTSMTLFEQKLQNARKRKEELYAEMKSQVDDEDVQRYYDSENNLSDVDLDILEE